MNYCPKCKNFQLKENFILTVCELCGTIYRIEHEEPHEVYSGVTSIFDEINDGDFSNIW